MGVLEAALRDELRTRTGLLAARPPAPVARERLRSPEAVRSFYERRGYAAAWLTSGAPGPRTRELLESLRGAATDGLRPSDYHAKPLAAGLVLAALPAEQTPASLAALELLATDAWLTLASDLRLGRVDPHRIATPGHTRREPGPDLAAELEAALDASGVAATLARQRPAHAGYARLREALALYRETAALGGWGVLPAGPALREGDRGEAVSALSARLAADPGARYRRQPPGVSGNDRFGPSLVGAVRDFQERHGLDPDGVVGERTRAALEVPVEQRIETLAVNLERWRWLPRALGPRRVVVNVPAFELTAIEDEAPTLRMRVVTGCPSHPTPPLSTQLTQLVLNPSWEVPDRLAAEDLLPRIQADSGYLERQGMHVLSGWGADARELDPATIDWAAFGPEGLPYRIRQDPGPRNPLGQVKFVLPNSLQIYLHDTPRRKLFEQPVRASSAGCVRLERALELADWLLADDPEWSPERVREAVAAGEERTVRLAAPLPAYLIYHTAWVDEDGRAHFRPDVYREDALLADALAAEDG